MLTGDEPTAPTIDEQRDVLLEHFELAVKLHGERHASRLMRKFGIKFSQHHPDPDTAKAGFVQCGSVDEWRAAVARNYASRP
jgi:tRNA-dihydrouridine synthase